MLTKPLSISVDDASISEPSATEFVQPRIIWPTMILGNEGFKPGDSPKFPSDSEYYERKRYPNGAHASPTFCEAIRLARTRVWMIDPYLLDDEHCARQLRQILSRTSASDIRIVTAGKSDAAKLVKLVQQIEPELNTRPVDRAPTRIRVSTNLNSSRQRGLPDIHDRFAIVDDILWHWGATVGGLHNAINAATTGWSAKNTDAIDFFERFWRLAEQK